jgi:hypothetical protein
MSISSIGESITKNLWNIGIASVADLKGKDPDVLIDLSNKYAGVVQDRCLLYTFRCATYFVNTDTEDRNPEKLKWWKWKDKRSK